MTKLELQQRNDALCASLQRMTELVLSQRHAIKLAKMHLGQAHGPDEHVGLALLSLVSVNDVVSAHHPENSSCSSSHSSPSSALASISTRSVPRTSGG